MPYISADAHQLLQAIVLELQALRRLIEADRAGIATGAQCAMIAAAFGVAGHRPFRAAELIELADRPGDPEAALRALIGGCTPKQLGKLLGAAVGRPCAITGLVLSGTKHRLAAIWRISHAHTPASR